ncbi:MAG: hypothetical protein HQL38_17660, partial [Alphaproteobacteria bacterium]|nr:hypothetical protein [Alphaproteobacteria bacterium]
ALPPQPQAPDRPPEVGGDVNPFTQSEIDVLQKLAERRESLEVRGRELDMREGLLKAAETRIDKKVVELKGLEASIQGLLKKYDQQEDAKMRSLVKIYETMKPKEAAKIFEQLEMPVLLEVIERMKEAKIAPIMAQMDPLKAKAVTTELASRRQMPIQGAQKEG